MWPDSIITISHFLLGLHLENDTFSFFKSLSKDMFIDFREGGKEGKRGTGALMKERNIGWLLLVGALTSDHSHMCPDWG